VTRPEGSDPAHRDVQPADPPSHEVTLRYRSLFDQHPDAVFELDLDGQLVTGNAALERMTGYSLPELLAMTYLPLVDTPDRARVTVEFARAAKGEARSYTAGGIHRDGQRFEVRVTNLPIVVDGQVIGVYGIARDASGERAALRALEESETRFRSIFAASASGIFVLDLDGAILQANPAFCAMIGYAGDELTTTNVWHLMHPDERADATVLAQDLVAGRRETVVIEARFRAKNGCMIWLKGSLSLVRWPSGAPRHPVGIVEDVTAHKQAEQRMRQGDALMRIAGSLAQLGGWSVDASTRALHWSPEIHAILDYPPEVMPNLTEALAHYSEQDRGTLTRAIDACLADGTSFDLDMEVLTATGRRIAVRSVGQAERDDTGRIVAVRGAFQDVTAQKQAAEHNQQLSEQLSRTLETISDGVGTVGPDWTVTHINRQAEILLDRPRHEVVGKHLLDVYPELTGSRTLEGYRRALEDREPICLRPFFFETIARWFEVKAYPSEPGIVIYFQDVTERIERERRLQAIATVEQQAAAHLRELDHVKNTFLTAVSHELRTPLTVVQGMAQTLQRTRGETDAPTRARIEDALADHAGRLSSLLDELLDVDRLARGGLTSERQACDVAVTAREVIDRAPSAERIVLDAPEQLHANVDPVQVGRILGNLIDNATKYAPVGPIDVRLRRRDEGVRIEVRDKGPGIPAGQLEHVFEPFHRAGDLGAKPGTGIGLALVAAFAQLHNGRAWAEPSPSGAHVVVELADIAV
jgi:PAS domain S-box-containing protein